MSKSSTDTKKRYVLQDVSNGYYVDAMTITATGSVVAAQPDLVKATRMNGGPGLDRLVLRANQFRRIRPIEVMQ